MSTLLLNNFNGSDGSTTFTDEVAGITWETTAGSPELDTDYKKFGSASILFEPSGSYVWETVRSNSFSSPNGGDWTFEFFFRFRNEVEIAAYAEAGDSSYSNVYVSMTAYRVAAFRQLYVEVLASDLSALLQVDQYDLWSSDEAWYHVAVVRDASANTYSCYFNGSRVQQSSSSTNAGAFARVSCAGVSYSSGGKKMWIDSVRLTNEVKYSGSTYTVPTEEFYANLTGSASITEAADSASATGVAWYPGFGGPGVLSLSGGGALERQLAGAGELSLSGVMAPAIQGLSGAGVLSLSGSGSMTRPDPRTFGAQWVWANIVAVPDEKARIDAQFSYQEIKVEPSP
jgi:hypothetical protein